MAFLLPALAPLVEMAGAAAAPAIEGLVGKEAAKVLTPAAGKALKAIAHSDAAKSVVGKVGGKLANSFFGKHSKTARNIAKKASSVMGVATGKTAHKVLGHGLDVASGLGILDKSQADSILDAHKKAMSLHDTLSAFNKKHDPLAPRVPSSVVKSLVGPAAAALSAAGVPPGMSTALTSAAMSAAGGGLNDNRPRHDKVIPSQIHIPQPYESFE